MLTKTWVLFLLALLSLLSCSQPDVQTDTQLTLRIQAQQTDLFEKMTDVQVSVFRKDAAWTPTSSVKLKKEAVRWPLDLPIVPSSAASLGSQVEAIVEAFAGDTRIAQARVVSKFVPDSLRVLEVWLQSCTDQPNLVCAEDACHGPDCATCEGGGSCVTVGITDATTLPVFSPSESPVVGTAPGGGSEMDAGSGGPDGGKEATDRIQEADPSACEPRCAAGMACVVAGSGTACRCPSGYEAVNDACEDVDECKTNNGGCSPNATCRNVRGGRACVCATGFTDIRGDGTECTQACDAGVCEPTQAATCPTCPSPGYCSRSGASATCVCPAGWTLGAAGCSPPPGCASVTCGMNATCAMSGQSASCICSHGYVLSGMDCVPIDECQTGTHTCGAGTCASGAGVGYSCTCPAGYQASSEVFPSCVVIDECKLATDPCGANGTCAAGAGVGYGCNCKQGYISNGQTFAACVPEDECTTGTHGCSPGGTCTQGAAVGYQCTCSKGYASSGGTYPKCPLEDECSTGTHSCSPGGTCTNGTGLGYSCMCNQGYTSSTGSYPKCDPVDECATGKHWCAPAASSCAAGATVGYDCQCPAGFTDSGGSFPQCYRSGTVQATYTAGVTFDFPAGTTTSCCTAGEFYVSSIANSQGSFFANNVEQRGVVSVSVASSTPLLSVPVPTTGYTRFGVPITQGSTYVSYAQEGDGSYYVIFRVTGYTSSTISLEFVYVYRP